MRNRKKNKMLYYANILIAISFALFLYGLILDLSGESRLFDPIKDAKVIKGDDSGSHTSIYNSDENSISSSNAENDDLSNTYSNNMRTQNLDINLVNSNFRDSIEKRYDIEIKYGSETDGYSVGGLSTTSIGDANTINSSLTKLNNVLSLYPRNLFKEIKNGGIPLTVYLINNYSEEGVTGATDSNFYFANMSIAVAYSFDESFFHESYHYIERYMLKKGLTYNALSWNSYNPIGFNYDDTIENSYSYNVSFSENSYFVNNYAQTSAEEDRASTFEYMMAPTKASCLNNNMPVWKKAKIMSETIDLALDSVSEDVVEYWERYL